MSDVLTWLISVAALAVSVASIALNAAKHRQMRRAFATYKNRTVADEIAETIVFPAPGPPSPRPPWPDVTGKTMWKPPIPLDQVAMDHRDGFPPPVPGILPDPTTVPDQDDR
jgi:hypothetical protein